MKPTVRLRQALRIQESGISGGINMKIIKEIKDFINSLKDGWKPFFIFVLLFQAIYSIVAVFGYLVWVIVSRRRLNKCFGKKLHKK